MSGASPAMQYAGLGLYVVAGRSSSCRSCISPPTSSRTCSQGGDYDPGDVAGLTFAVFFTRQDFSFWLNLSIAKAVCSWLCDELFLYLRRGRWFAFGMVALASGYILYYTSNVLHHSELISTWRRLWRLAS